MFGFRKSPCVFIILKWNTNLDLTTNVILLFIYIHYCKYIGGSAVSYPFLVAPYLIKYHYMSIK